MRSYSPYDIKILDVDKHLFLFQNSASLGQFDPKRGIIGINPYKVELFLKHYKDIEKKDKDILYNAKMGGIKYIVWRVKIASNR